MSQRSRSREKTKNLFIRVIRNALRSQEPLTVSQWAERFRVLDDSSNLAGKWSNDITPYLREIMDAISDTAVKKVVAMLGAQLGKTEGLILNTIGYYMHFDPSPILVM